MDFSSAFAFNDKTVARLKGGPLLKEIIERMKAKVQCLKEPDEVRRYACGSLFDLTFYGYSADPFVVEAMMATLGATPTALPGKASAALIELWDVNGTYEVRALYRPSASEMKLTEIGISGCGELNCTLTTFEKRSKTYIPVDWRKECGIITNGLKPECQNEVNKAEDKNCMDWAESNLCREQTAVRFVFCRKTCLCDEKFAEKIPTFRHRLV